MADKLALDLPVLLPDALDGRDRCVHRLVASLDQQPGLDEVHVLEATETEPARLCLHYDPACTDLDRIRRLAHDAGAELTDRYRHVLWPLRTKAAPRRAAAAERTLRALPGVVDVTVGAGVLRAELESSAGVVAALRAAARSAGLDLGEDGPAVAPVLGDHEGSPDHDDRRADRRDRDEHDRDEHEHEHDHDGAGRRHGEDHGEDHRHGEDHGHGGRLGARAELVAAVTAAVVWVVGLVVSLTAGEHSGPAVGSFVAAFVLAGWFTARETVEKLRARAYEIDLLMLVAAIGAAAIGHWRDAALLLVLFGLGHSLESSAMRRARRSIAALADLAPDTAILRDGERGVPVASLRPGDVVLVRPNARVAADGLVIAGTSSVDQAVLTGESVPVDKSPVEDLGAALADPDRAPASSRVFAGTINGAGRLEVRVLRRAGESTIARIAAMVRDAETEPSPTQRFTERFQRVFVPAVLALVVVTFGLVLATGGGWRDALLRALAVLVAASPCALALAIPSAVLAAIGRAGQHGVLIKGGAALQQLGAVRAVAFDKTGTLTAGRPRLVDVRPVGETTAAELLETAVAIERHSDHPLAQAIVRDAPAAGAERAGATSVTSLAGRGVVGRVDGREVVIGSPALFAGAATPGLLPAEAAAAVAELERQGRTIVVVARDGEVLGALGLLDTPREGARAAVEGIRAVGVAHTVVLSGDHQAAVDAVAVEVGVDDARGDLLPADKVREIDRLRAEHARVAMVGDGVNDAPALAHASVGIAMGAAGSDVALETADVALMGDDLAALPFALGLGRRATSVIRQNLIASLGIVAVLLVLTAAGLAGIGPAVVLHEGSTLLVVANALRLLRHPAPARPAAAGPTGATGGTGGTGGATAGTTSGTATSLV